MAKKTMLVEKKIFKDNKFKTSPQEPINFEIKDNQGMLVDYPCYQKIIGDWLAGPGLDIPPTENIAYYFGKELLLFLLSFDECEGLIFCKCINPDTGDQSIAICAVDGEIKALGATTGDKNKFVGGEWGLGLTNQKVQDCLEIALNGDKVLNVDKFFASFYQMFNNQ
jgi:hypothetical protein